ncbi:hypothetical protein Lal_00049256 [Lupinus albus]|nr:hypothetical protein Lal_00049256 [Lupinus albus]
MGRSWSNQSTMFLLSPCPSGKCSVEVPAWPHSAELPQHHGSSSQSSGSAPWAVQHGWSHGAVVVEQSTMFLLSPCPSGKCSVEVPAWPHSAELVCCGIPRNCRASTVARSARKVVVLGEPFMGIYAEHEGASVLGGLIWLTLQSLGIHAVPYSCVASGITCLIKIDILNFWFSTLLFEGCGSATCVCD